jgi:hypothetical protein
MTTPRETEFDANGEPIALGDKFYAPGDELLIAKQGSGEWVNAKDLAKTLDSVESEYGPDFEPVPDSDATYFPYGRPNP